MYRKEGTGESTSLNTWGLASLRDYYCKRAILCLSSSKIFTPHPPLRPASVYPPPLLRGEDTLAGRRGGWGSIFWKTRDIELPSYSNNLSTFGLYSMNKTWDRRKSPFSRPVFGLKLLYDYGLWEVFTAHKQWRKCRDDSANGEIALGIWPLGRVFFISHKQWRKWKE